MAMELLVLLFLMADCVDGVGGDSGVVVTGDIDGVMVLVKQVVVQVVMAVVEVTMLALLIVVDCAVDGRGGSVC